MDGSQPCVCGLAAASLPYNRPFFFLFVLCLDAGWLLGNMQENCRARLKNPSNVSRIPAGDWDWQRSSRHQPVPPKKQCTVAIWREGLSRVGTVPSHANLCHPREIARCEAEMGGLNWLQQRGASLTGTPNFARVGLFISRFVETTRLDEVDLRSCGV